jgi:hypothetical protein
MAEFDELKIDGTVATPGDPDWDQQRQAWNLAADPHPAAVAFVEGADDVAATLRFAADHDLRVIGQGTGHGAVAVGSFDDTIVIKTERMRGVEVDGHTARVEAGVLGEELGAAAQQASCCSLPGSSPNVGVVGYTLGGGLSWLGRKYGFACNRVTAIELVTADGEQRTVDADNEPELFWALRGGGGSYAIVAALHVELLPIAEAYAGVAIYPAAAGETAIAAYRDWAAQAPDEVTSVVRYLRPPPLPDVPEPLRDVPLLTIDAAVVGDLDGAEDLVAPLRKLGEPIMDNWGRMPIEDLYRLHMDPEPPVPALTHHALVRELPDEAIAAFIERAGPDAGSPLLLAELRQLRGALGRPTENAGALSHLDADYAMFGAGMPVTPEIGQAIDGHLDELVEAMTGWGGDGAYFNFYERPCDVDVIFDSATCDRLAEVKRAWDPDDLIRSNHAVTVAAG